jgi:hypothetical protein
MNKIVVLGNLGALGNLGDLNVLEKLVYDSRSQISCFGF